MRTSLALLVLLTACTGTNDKPADTAGDSDTDGDTDLPTDDTGTTDPHAPSAPEIVIAPAAPPAGVGFSVVFVTPSVDPDGDLVAYRYAWTENGTAPVATVPIPGAWGADGASAHLKGGPVTVPSTVLAALRDAGVEVLVAPADVSEASRDWWPLAMHWALAGEVPQLAGAVLVQ